MHCSTGAPLEGSQGGYYIIDSWSPGYADKEAYVNLPMSFPSNAWFGLATSMGVNAVVVCSDINKTQIKLSTKNVANLHAYILAIGY